jgi:hypothetical protein
MTGKIAIGKGRRDGGLFLLNDRGPYKLAAVVAGVAGYQGMTSQSDHQRRGSIRVSPLTQPGNTCAALHCIGDCQQFVSARRYAMAHGTYVGLRAVLKEGGQRLPRYLGVVH